MSDLERLGAGFGLDGPGAVLAEAGGGGVAVLEELQVGYLPVDDLDQDREGGTRHLVQRLRLVAEVAEHGHVLAGREHRGHVERLDFPAPKYAPDLFEERLRAAGGAGPRQALAELRVIGVERYVGGVGGDHAADGIRVPQALQ